MNKIINILTIGSVVILASGCGGSGSSKDNVIENPDPVNEPGTNNNNPEMPYTPAHFSKKSLTEENAESIATETAKVIDYLIQKHNGFAVLGNTLVKDDNLQRNRIDSESCSRGGNMSFEVNAPAKMSHRGHQVWSKGDIFTRTYDRCGDETSRLIYLDGQIELATIEGVYDGEIALEAPTVFSHNYDNFGMYEYFSQMIYKDGILVTSVDTGSLTISTDEFVVYEHINNYDVDFKISNLNLTIADDPGTYDSFDSFSLSSNSPFLLELGDSEILIELSIMENLIEDRFFSHSPNKGEIEITSETGVLKMQFKDGFFDYMLDTQGDGDFEIIGMVSDSKY